MAMDNASGVAPVDDYAIIALDDDCAGLTAQVGVISQVPDAVTGRVTTQFTHQSALRAMSGWLAPVG